MWSSSLDATSHQGAGRNQYKHSRANDACMMQATDAGVPIRVYSMISYQISTLMLKLTSLSKWVKLLNGRLFTVSCHYITQSQAIKPELLCNQHTEWAGIHTLSWNQHRWLLYPIIHPICSFLKRQFRDRTHSFIIIACKKTKGLRLPDCSHQGFESCLVFTSKLCARGLTATWASVHWFHLDCKVTQWV